MSTSYSEKRSAIRMLINCAVNISNDSHPGYEGICRNLSVDGIGVDTSYEARPQEQLTINVRPPDGANVQPLSVTVEVLRSTSLPSDAGHLYHMAARIIATS